MIKKDKEIFKKITKGFMQSDWDELENITDKELFESRPEIIKVETIDENADRMLTKQDKEIIKILDEF